MGSGDCLHGFVPLPKRKGDGWRCDRCGELASADYAAGYETGLTAGLDAGRREAWAHPPGRGLSRSALALSLAGAFALAGAAPPEALPEPPPHEALVALEDCAAAARALEADVESTWGRAAGPDVAARTRAGARASADETVEAASLLSLALDDARACARSSVPDCSAYMTPLLAARRAAVTESAARLRHEVASVRLPAAPEPPR